MLEFMDMTSVSPSSQRTAPPAADCNIVPLRDITPLWGSRSALTYIIRDSYERELLFAGKANG